MPCCILQGPRKDRPWTVVRCSRLMKKEKDDIHISYIIWYFLPSQIADLKHTGPTEVYLEEVYRLVHDARFFEFHDL